MKLSDLKWGLQTVPPGHFLLIFALLAMPVVSPAFFGWMNGLLALPIFSILYVYGSGRGGAVLRIAFILVGVLALLLQRLDVYLFGLTAAPLGVTLYQSSRNRDMAAYSGGKGVAVLAASWLLFWGGFGLLTQTNPYTALVQTLDLGFQQTLEIYSSKEAGLTPEVLYGLQNITNTMRTSIPRLLPGILATVVIGTVWLNMVLINRLLQRTGTLPWGPYADWVLPEYLVWGPIVAILSLLIGDGLLQDIGGCLLLVFGIVYFFQGMAVLLTLFNRWRVPTFARFLLYAMLVIQTYSLPVVAVLGMSDVWINLRRKSDQR